MALRVQHPALSELADIDHGFFTRNGGTSNDPYNSLNCGYGSSDDREQVTQNRAKVANCLNVDAGRLVTAYQVHSAKAVVATAPFPQDTLPKADAIVTNTPGLAVAVLTADCGPLLFADPEARVVAAAHAGWRGAFGGIIEATLEVMQSLGARTERIIAILGPTISGPNYEVDLGFKDNFLKQDQANHSYFHDHGKEGHALFDLPAYIMARLEACNLQTAINLNFCTYDQEAQFFSYRRATHRNEPDYGRQISAIALF